MDFEIEEGNGNPSPYFMGTLYLKLGEPDKPFLGWKSGSRIMTALWFG